MSLINDPTRILSPLMKLTAYSDPQMTSQVGSVLLPYDVKAMDVSYENVILDNETLSGQNGGNSYKGAKSSDLSVDFLLDDTTYSNLIAFALPLTLIPDSVDNLIKKLIKYCHTPNSELAPNFVMLKPFGMPLMDSPGGGFKGQLLSMKVKTEMVNILGERVKAKVSCTFKESLPSEQLNKTIASTAK